MCVWGGGLGACCLVRYLSNSIDEHFSSLKINEVKDAMSSYSFSAPRRQPACRCTKETVEPEKIGGVQVRLPLQPQNSPLKSNHRFEIDRVPVYVPLIESGVL